jgi:hypothetical protein
MHYLNINKIRNEFFDRYPEYISDEIYFKIKQRLAVRENLVIQIRLISHVRLGMIKCFQG